MPITSTGTGPSRRLTSSPTRSNGVKTSDGRRGDSQIRELAAQERRARWREQFDANTTPSPAARRSATKLGRAGKKGRPLPDRPVKIEGKAAQVAQRLENRLRLGLASFRSSPCPVACRRSACTRCFSPPVTPPDLDVRVYQLMAGVCHGQRRASLRVVNRACHVLEFRQVAASVKDSSRERLDRDPASESVASSLLESREGVFDEPAGSVAQDDRGGCRHRRLRVDRPVSAARRDHQSFAALQGRADAALPIAARRGDRCGPVARGTIRPRRWRR